MNHLFRHNVITKHHTLGHFQITQVSKKQIIDFLELSLTEENQVISFPAHLTTICLYKSKSMIGMIKTNPHSYSTSVTIISFFP